MYWSMADLKKSQRPWNQYLHSNFNTIFSITLNWITHLRSQICCWTKCKNRCLQSTRADRRKFWLRRSSPLISHTMKGFTPEQNALTGKGCLLCSLKALCNTISLEIASILCYIKFLLSAELYGMKFWVESFCLKRKKRGHFPFLHNFICSLLGTSAKFNWRNKI